MALYKGTFCGIDVENSVFPQGLPWFKGFYLSVVSVTTDTRKKSWILTHSENENDESYFLYDKAIAEIQQEINKYDVLVGHNLKHDINVLKYFGLDVSKHKLFCTMVAEYLIRGQERGLSLDELASRYKFKTKDNRIKKMWDAGTNTADIPLSILIPYCEHDCEAARNVAIKQRATMFRTGMLKLFNLQMEFLDCLSDMEIHGFKWDREKADEIIKKYSKYQTIIEKRLYKLFGRDDINLDSNDDLSACLYGGHIKRSYIGPVKKFKNVRVQMPYIFTYKDGRKVIKVRWKDHKNCPILKYQWKERYERITGLGIVPLRKTETSKSIGGKYKYYKTNKEILPGLKTTTYVQRLAVALLLKRSSLAKLSETFLGKQEGTGLCRKVSPDGRIHTNFNQTVTATGRLSSSNPNGQNLPRGNTSPIKKCIVPTLDGIMGADLSQIEWRVPAQLSQDTTMINEINNGVDQHVAACTELMELPFVSKSDPESKNNRHNAKIFNFRMIYGGSAYGFHMDTKMPNFGVAKWGRVVKGFYDKYSGFKDWQDQLIVDVIKNHGRMVSPTGRLFVFPLDHTGKFNERTIKNYPVQGMAGGDILPLATVYIRKRMRRAGLKSKMILTVHDSIIFDYVKSEEKDLATICMQVFNNLPKLMQSYFNINWNVNLTGEVEVGKNYADQKRIM